MKKYEIDILFGTILTLVGVWCLYSLGLNLFFGWFIIIIGKAIIFVSGLEYVDRKRAIRGEDLNKDPKIRKKIRKIQRKRY